VLPGKREYSLRKVETCYKSIIL